MKHLKTIFFIAAGAMVAFGASSCKRGKEDPFLSFRSRDGRLAGTWNLTGWEGKTTTTSISGSTTSVSTTTRSYTGGTLTATTTNSGGSSSSTSKFNFQMTLEKDGSYSSKIDNFNASGTLTSSNNGDGYWNWLSDGKNKSSVNIYDPTGFNITGVSEVLGLKNKKLILKRHARSKSASGNNSYEQEVTDTYTFEAQ